MEPSSELSSLLFSPDPDYTPAQPSTQDIALDKNCHHYQKLADVPWDIQKYWQQRYSIWSLYDSGVQMTDSAWFGVTPEPVAWRVAQDFVGWLDGRGKKQTTVIDIFAGAGGNATQFALSGHWERVVAIELDPSTLACARHNAQVYGVEDKITFVNSDCFEYINQHLKSSLTDPEHIYPDDVAIFASPPWGGPQYKGDKVFNLDTMEPYSGMQIHELVREMDHALFLPRTSDLRQIAKWDEGLGGEVIGERFFGGGGERVEKEKEKIECVQYCMEGASKALVAYVPAARDVREK